MAKTNPDESVPVRQRGVTMKDVANHAGVSRTAVSFVLSNRENASISEETRARINRRRAGTGLPPQCRRPCAGIPTQ